MAEFSAQYVKALRDRTGAGFMDCKRALEEAGGDIDKATGILRERGLAAAARKSGREAREGLVSSYIHTGGRVGVLIEVNCETDFVARTEEFQKLVRDLAVQVAGLAPQWVTREDVPEEAIQAKRRELAEDPRARDDIESNINRWLKESVLYEQPFRDSNMAVRDLIHDRIATIGENILVRRFTRYALGEEL
ncbi:MAG: translation elongation factor Ts [Chloroflexi bacterium]|nr:MAG: translation elongation factor Ts [Chloroflexota bacterium]